MNRAVAESAIVVGAGIGGLTAAIALQHAEVAVTVLEQSASLDPVGAGLTLQPNAVRALRWLGLGEAVEAAAQPLRSAEIRDVSGRLLVGLNRHRGSAVFDAVRAPALGIHRATLQRLLLDALRAETIHLNQPIRALGADGRSVETASGERFSGDVIVGADGLHSTIRAELLGPAAPVYSGYFCWRGVGPLASFSADWAGEYWGRGVRFGGCGIDGERLYWFLVANGPAGGQDGGGAYQAARAAADRFPAEVREAIAETPAEAVFRTDICDRDPVTRWGVDRVTLLGDAAHPMTPNLGQGACQAIEDAAALAAAVRHVGTRPAALREYERRRINRTNAVVRAARALGRVGQWSNPVATTGRNTAARLLPPTLVSRQLVRSWS